MHLLRLMQQIPASGALSRLEARDSYRLVRNLGPNRAGFPDATLDSQMADSPCVVISLLHVLASLSKYLLL